MRTLAGSILVLAASLFASAALLRRGQGGDEWWPFAASLVVAALGFTLVIIGSLEDRPR